MTINEEQDQSISGCLELNLSYPCFSHNQHLENRLFLTLDADFKIRNVVYDEIFSNLEETNNRVHFINLPKDIIEENNNYSDFF